MGMVLVRPARVISPGLRALVMRRAPSQWLRDGTARERLLWAGFEGDDALVVYAGIRVALLVAMPAIAALTFMARPMLDTIAAVLFALVAAWLVPLGGLHVMARQRQARMRRGILDALDLLVVCVEAGSSIESAMRLVARETLADYPELASELGEVVRKTKAGMARADALRALYTRTGMPELRLISASIIQSERWGTSVAKGLRACAETLWTARRQAAERRAWIAPIKMAVVLVGLILAPLLMLGYQLSAFGHQ